MSSNKAAVLLSGGQDSTTCLYWAKQQFDDVAAFIFDYGQRHRIEIGAAIRIAEFADVSYRVISLQFPQDCSALLNSDAIGMQDEGLPNTFVPGRNLQFLLTAAMYAYSRSIFNLVTGVCQTDYSGYPDCRADTLISLQTTLNLGMFASGGKFTIHAPLMKRTKAETVLMARTLPGCWEALASTHTCYEGKKPPCGICPACKLRAKGFAEAGEIDPILG
jgi:7-cyano-7-deazaguanine synthase